MNLLAPLGLWSLLALPVIFILYLIQSRGQRRPTNHLPVAPESVSWGLLRKANLISD